MERGRAILWLTCVRMWSDRLAVLGLVDYNPHGVALLMCYRHGSIRSAREGSRFGTYARTRTRGHAGRADMARHGLT